MKLALFIFILLFFSACSTPQTTPEVAKPSPTPKPMIALAWDGRHREAAQWTEMLELAVLTSKLSQSVPADIKTFCPGYEKGDRIAFWMNLVAIMTKFESSYNPESKYTESFSDSTGKKVVSRGLLQISQESANGYGCGISRAEMLHDPKVNLTCGVAIMSKWVVQDGRVAGLVDGKWRGCARYWSVCRDIAGKKSYPAIKAHLNGLESCQ